MIYILHAYSRKNAGDGLLVDLTMNALSDAGIPRDNCCVLALDADSFSDLDKVVQHPSEPTPRFSHKLIRGSFELAKEFIGSTFLGGNNSSQVSKITKDASGFVAVGGGYLVGDSFVRQSGILLNHLVQLRTAARSSLPTVYLPQSIGPLKGIAKWFTKGLFPQIDMIYARDDETYRELEGSNVKRCADLAALKLGTAIDNLSINTETNGEIVFVARDIGHSGYAQSLQVLGDLLPNSLWAVQANSGGGRSDALFNASIGMSSSGSLKSILETRRPAVSISVRLHGALSSLLAGVPSIHLAYERKGWGAYEDLGITEYVHDARNFDPELVASQAEQLKKNSVAYWGKVKSNAESLSNQYWDLVEDLKLRLSK